MENDPFGPKGTPSEWPWRLTRHSELKVHEILENPSSCLRHNRSQAFKTDDRVYYWACPRLRGEQR